MKAIMYDAVGARPEFREVGEPACPPGGAVIAVRATGVCRSDWHAWRGHDPVELPHVPGHEFAGVVAAVGAGVTGFAVGDRVTAPFVNGCGVCEWCRSGNAQVCPDQTQPGFTHWGSFAERVVVRAADTNLVRLPDALDFVSAAALGCRFATAFRALTGHGPAAGTLIGHGPAAGTLTGHGPAAGTLTGNVPAEGTPTGHGPAEGMLTGRGPAEGTVAVFGCGGVGLSAVMIAVALGNRVLAVDPSPAASALAASLGATVVHEIVDEADVAIDAYGSAATARASVRALRRRGRHVQVGLMLGPDGDAPLPWGEVVAKELQVVGSHGMAAADYPAMLDLVASGRLEPRRLVGSVIPLAEAGDALTAMDSPIPAHSGMVVAVTGE